MSKDTILLENIAFSNNSNQADQLVIASRLLESLQNRIDALENRIIKQSDEIAALKATANTQADNEEILFRLIKDLREAGHKDHPGKMEISRAEKIEKYLQSRPDHRVTFETLKGHLGTNKFLLNKAIKTLMDSHPGRYGITRMPGDKRKRTLILL